MQIVQEQKHVISQGILEKTEFTIKAGAHIMAVLSGLYKNPIDAMVREYLTNMYDAYFGCDGNFIPPIIRVPGPLSPNLEFEDFGMGMSKETVMKIYSQYGNSTKNDDNIAVGGFGLGSKTAFCYNSGSPWMISSRFNGMKYTFMAHVNKDGIPELSLVGEQKTTEPNGVTISVPIRREHTNEVQNAVAKYAPYFPLELVVAGMTVDKNSYSLEGSFWKIKTVPRNSDQSGGRYSSYSYGGRNGTTQIIMGNVPYVLDRNNTQRLGVSQDLESFFSYNPIDIFVDVGSVDIVPSRDDLKYNDRTIAHIKHSFENMAKELPTVVEREIRDSKTEWEAYTLYAKMIQDYRFPESVAKKFTYKNKSINLLKGVVRPISDLKQHDKKAEVVSYFTDGNSSQIQNEIPSQFEMKDPFTYVCIDNMPKRGVKITKALADKHFIERTHSGRKAHYGHKVGVVYGIKTHLTKPQLSDILGGFPEVKILTTSELSGHLIIPKSVSTQDTIYRFGYSNRWEARVKIPDKPGKTYFLPLTKQAYSGKFQYMDGKAQVLELTGLARNFNIRGLGGTDEPIYGIKTDEIENFDKKKWVNLQHAVENDAVKKVRAAVKNIAYYNVPINKTEENLYAVISQLKLSTTKYFDKLYESITEIKKAKTSLQDVESAYRYLRDHSHLSKEVTTVLKEVTDFPTPNLGEMREKIFEKYPMLRTIAYLMARAAPYHDYTMPAPEAKEIEQYIKSLN